MIINGKLNKIRTRGRKTSLGFILYAVFLKRKAHNIDRLKETIKDV